MCKACDTSHVHLPWGAGADRPGSFHTEKEAKAQHDWISQSQEKEGCGNGWDGGACCGAWTFPSDAACGPQRRARGGRVGLAWGLACGRVGLTLVSPGFCAWLRPLRRDPGTPFARMLVGRVRVWVHHLRSVTRLPSAGSSTSHCGAFVVAAALRFTGTAVRPPDLESLTLRAPAGAAGSTGWLRLARLGTRVRRLTLLRAARRRCTVTRGGGAPSRRCSYPTLFRGVPRVFRFR